MGYLAGVRDDWEAARPFFSESLEVLEGLARGGQQRVGQSEVEAVLFKALLNLGEADRLLGRFEESLDLRKRALEMAEDRNNLAWKALAVHEIGETYHGMNERGLAQLLFNQALELYRQTHNFVRVERLAGFMTAEGYPVVISQD